MKSRIYAPIVALFMLTFTICENKSGKPKPKPKPQTEQQMKEEDHETMCNILGYASNIFGNFVHIVRENDNKEAIGQQVGHIAQNLFHIAAEATKSCGSHKSAPKNLNVLEYLDSKEFKQELEEIILEQLNS